MFWLEIGHVGYLKILNLNYSNTKKEKFNLRKNVAKNNYGHNNEKMFIVNLFGFLSLKYLHFYNQHTIEKSCSHSDLFQNNMLFSSYVVCELFKN